MRQGNLPRGQEFFPSSHVGGQGITALCAQVPALCVVADQQEKLQLRHGGEQAPMPLLATNPRRRQIRPTAVLPGKAERHRHGDNAPGVVKLVPIHAHPLAQALSGRVVEWQPAAMHVRAGRLAAHADPRRSRQPCHRPWCMSVQFKVFCTR